MCLPDQDFQKFIALWESEAALKRKCCPFAGIDMWEMNSEAMIEDCAVPQYREKVDYEFPKDVKTYFVATMRKFKDLFITKLGTTTVTSHHITTTEPPVCLPPRRIPAHFQDKVEVQICPLSQRAWMISSFIPAMAAVYGMNQFRYYLLGWPFELWTDHCDKPLKWLANQKLEGMLERWALAL